MAISFGIPSSLSITGDLTVSGNSQVVGSLTLSALTASTLVYVNASKVATSITLNANVTLIAGTLALNTELVSINSITAASGNFLTLAGGDSTHGVLANSQFQVQPTLAAGAYGLSTLGASGAARDIFIAGQNGVSNGFTVQYDGTKMVYNFGGSTSTLGIGGSLAVTGTTQHTGSVGIGGAANTANALLLYGSTTTGTNQAGVNAQPVFTSAATGEGAAMSAVVQTQAASFTMANARGLHILDAIKGAGSTITNNYGLYVDALSSGGTSNYAVFTAGTTPSSFGGSVTATGGYQSAGGFFAQGTAGNFATGSGVEVLFNTGSGIVRAYNRTGSSALPLILNDLGGTVTIGTSSSAAVVAGVLNVNGTTASTSTSTGALIVNNVFAVGGASGNVFAAGTVTIDAGSGTQNALFQLIARNAGTGFTGSLTETGSGNFVYNTPTGGSHIWNVNGSTVASASASTFTVGGNLTVTGGNILGPGSGNLVIVSGSTRSLVLQTNGGANALTLDASGNGTLAGNIFAAGGVAGLGAGNSNNSGGWFVGNANQVLIWPNRYFSTTTKATTTGHYSGKLEYDATTGIWTMGGTSTTQTSDATVTNDVNALTISAAGNVTATGILTALSATAIPAGGTAGTGYLFSSTANFGVMFGSGAPTLSAAKGSLYLRSDGSGTTNRAYINTDGGTTWTALTTSS